MKTLTLILALTFAIHGQDLVSADGKEWTFLASGAEDGFKGKAVNVYARRVKSDTYPTLEVLAGENRVIIQHDCKQKAYRLSGNESWKKPPRGSVGERMVKFACKK